MLYVSNLLVCLYRSRKQSLVVRLVALHRKVYSFKTLLETHFQMFCTNVVFLGSASYLLDNPPLITRLNRVHQPAAAKDDYSNSVLQFFSGNALNVLCCCQDMHH